MGCSGSKIDDLPVVSLCRERSRFIEDAVQQRYLLSAAHLSYVRSLREVGAALEAFLDSEHVSAVACLPVLPLPTRRKSDPVPLPASNSPPPSAGGDGASHAPSDSDHHLHFDSDDEESLSDDRHHLRDGESPQPAAFREPVMDFGYGRIPTPPYTVTNQYFMRSRPTPSVVYEERMQSPGKVRWGNSYPSYPSNSGFAGFFSNAGGASSSIPPPPYSAQPPENRAPPPSPPPPPRNSTWDFLNPFYGYEGYYSSYLPIKYSDNGSRDSREVREEEGIPDLEEESQSDVAREMHGKSDGHPGRYYQKNSQFHREDSIMSEEDKGGDNRVTPEGKSSVGSEYEEDDERELVDKNVIENDEAAGRRNSSEFPGSYDAFDPVKQIKIQFDRASESGSDVSAILEVGKLPYRHRNAVHRVSVRMLGTMAPPMSSSSWARPSTSKATDPQLPSSVEPPSPARLDFEDATWLRSRKLSTTLEKLYVWEKKLFEEVKTEEKLRIIQERKRKQLKRMNDKGSEAHKVEAVRALIRSLSTKIRISIHFVDSVSTKINKLRDEELWLQIVELLHGLVKMWKTMLECHQNQCRIISQAKTVGIIADGVVSSESHIRATVRLQLELLNWISSFYVWVAAQKGYVRALNCWLLKCILHEPEETPDGIVPFSPGRIGAPLVFVICNRWWQAIEGISEKEVIEAMWTFSIGIFQLWQQYSSEQRSRLMSINSPKDMERRIKALQKDEQKIQNAWDALNRKLFLVPVENGLSSTNQIIDQTRSDTFGGIKAGLKRIFDAIVKFTESSLKAYEELKP